MSESPSTSDEIKAEIERLSRELAAREKAEREAARESSQPVFRYTIMPVGPKSRASEFDRIFDDTCVLYRIEGVCVNRDQAKAIGWAEHELQSGAMNYLYNKTTHKIVCSISGGTMYISNPWVRGNTTDYAGIAMAQVNRFLETNPEGGDITYIINGHKAAKKMEA